MSYRYSLMNTKLIIVISVFFLFLTLASVSASENSTDLQLDENLKESDVLQDSDEVSGDESISKLDTQIVPGDIQGEEGDSVDVSFEIFDENNNPVMNGTATLSMGDKNYSGEVSNGSVSFHGIIIEKGISKAKIFYHGNDYYNSSETDIDVYLIEESYMNMPIYDDGESIGTALYEEPYTQEKSVSAVKAISDSRQTGNPIFMMLLSFIIIVSSGIIVRKR